MWRNRVFLEKINNLEVDVKQLKSKSLFGVPAMILCSIVGCLNAGWWQTFGGADSDIGYCVQQTTDGGYIVAGETYSFGRPGEPDMWLIKLDSLGHKEWDRTYEPGAARSVRQTSDGGYIIAGNWFIKTDSEGEIIWGRDYGGAASCVQITGDGAYIATGQKSASVWIIKLSESGDSLWSKTYRKGNYYDGGNYIIETQDGGYIIAGSTSDEDPEIEDVKFALWLMKINVNGDTSWTKTYGGEDWGDLDHGYCVIQTVDEGFLITGRLQGSIWLLRTNDSGDTLWTKALAGGTGKCIKETLDGNYIVTGEGPVAEPGNLQFPTGGDLWLAKVNLDGDTIWTRSYGGDKTDEGLYVEQTTDSGYIITGYTWSFGEGRDDLYLLKTDSLGLLAVSEKPNIESLTNWEMMSSLGPYVALRYWDRPQGFAVDVFDASGRKVAEVHSSRNSGVITWGEGHSPGVYFIKPKQQNKSAKVVILR